MFSQSLIRMNVFGDLAISFPLNQIFCLVSIYEINSIFNSLFVNVFSIIAITIVYIIYF